MAMCRYGQANGGRSGMFGTDASLIEVHELIMVNERAGCSRRSKEERMYDLIVMTFDKMDAAAEARKAIRQMQNEGRLSLEDAAVLRSDASGKVEVDNELSRDVKI